MNHNVLSPCILKNARWYCHIWHTLFIQLALTLWWLFFSFGKVTVMPRPCLALLLFRLGKHWVNYIILTHISQLNLLKPEAALASPGERRTCCIFHFKKSFKPLICSKLAWHISHDRKWDQECAMSLFNSRFFSILLFGWQSGWI